MNKILYFQKTLPSVHQQQMFRWESHKITQDFPFDFVHQQYMRLLFSFCKTFCKIYVKINQQ